MMTRVFFLHARFLWGLGFSEERQTSGTVFSRSSGIHDNTIHVFMYICIYMCVYVEGSTRVMRKEC